MQSNEQHPTHQRINAIIAVAQDTGKRTARESNAVSLEKRLRQSEREREKRGKERKRKMK